MKLSIIVPVYNEFLFIMEVIKRIQSVELPVDREIIIVDDYSTDGTREVLKTFTGSNLKVLYHEKNYGKGRAIRTAIEHVTGDFTVIQDADLEYQPKDFNKMLEPLLEGVADVVYGSRFGGEMHRVLYFWHFMGNNFLTLLSNMFSDLNLSDMETCYKMFRTPILKKLTLVSDDFCIEPEITAKVAKMKCRIFETSISYQGRTYEEGKKIGWRDGFKAFFAIIRFNLFDNTIPDDEI